MYGALVRKHAKAVKLSAPALIRPDDCGGICDFHLVIYVGKKNETVTRLVLILKNYRLVDADGYVRSLNRVVVNRDFGYRDKQLLPLVFKPADDAQIQDRLAICCNGPQRVQ